MRINLRTPFAEKDAVKALGARWDAAKKLWYIVDVDDLTPFLRWIPNLETTPGGSTTAAQTTKPASPPLKPSISINDVPHCGCDIRPWEDCIHTSAR
jgi:hypothetical protein